MRLARILPTQPHTARRQLPKQWRNGTTKRYSITVPSYLPHFLISFALRPRNYPGATARQFFHLSILERLEKMPSSARGWNEAREYNQRTHSPDLQRRLVNVLYLLLYHTHLVGHDPFAGFRAFQRTGLSLSSVPTGSLVSICSGLGGFLPRRRSRWVPK